jgi:hypothetical protein
MTSLLFVVFLWLKEKQEGVVVRWCGAVGRKLSCHRRWLHGLVVRSRAGSDRGVVARLTNRATSLHNLTSIPARHNHNKNKNHNKIKLTIKIKKQIKQNKV